MAIISANVADQIRTFFADNLQDPVTVELFTQKPSPLVVPGRHECEYCQETEDLLSEVVALSPKLSLDVHDLRADAGSGAAEKISEDMVPAIILHGHDRGKLRFFGIPAGNEFSTLIQDIADVSKGSTALSEDTVDQLANLTSDVHIRVFVTPT